MVGGTLVINNGVASHVSRFPMPLAIVCALLAALACGLWNGLLVTRLGLQPIIATLILMVAGRGIAQLLTGGQIEALQPQLKVLFEAGMTFFRFVTRLRYFKGFCDLPLDARRRWVRTWAPRFVGRQSGVSRAPHAMAFRDGGGGCSGFARVHGSPPGASGREEH